MARCRVIWQRETRCKYLQQENTTMNEQQRQQARQILAEYGKVLPYSTHDFGREQDENCLSVILGEGKIRSTLDTVRAALPSGLVAFIGTRGVELVAGSGTSQFAILRIARSDAINYGKTTEDLIAKLQRYDEQFGIDIWHAEVDTVEFALEKYPADMAAFAQDLYEFCPDIVDQGVGSVAALEQRIEVMGEVYLWWD